MSGEMTGNPATLMVPLVGGLGCMTPRSWVGCWAVVTYWVVRNWDMGSAVMRGVKLVLMSLVLGSLDVTESLMGARMEVTVVVMLSTLGCWRTVITGRVTGFNWTGVDRAGIV